MDMQDEVRDDLKNLFKSMYPDGVIIISTPKSESGFFIERWNRKK